MKELVFATNNQHKIREVQEILGPAFLVRSLEDIGLSVEIPETGDTLEANASQKARFIFERSGMNCFADDTGLEIDTLDGRPGVYSARYAGPECSFDDNIDKVLSELGDTGQRNACFRCVIALIIDGQEHLFEGRVNGVITTGRRGASGFGYDPVFQPEGSHQTFAEMPAYLKNGISHRGKAVSRMVRFLAPGK